MISNILSDIRKSKGFTMKSVAEAIDMKPDTYRNYESGRLEPNLTTLTKLADFYHVTTDYLLGREEKAESALDALSYEFDMSLLEKKITEGYLALPKSQRENVMDFIVRMVDETHEETVRKNAEAAQTQQSSESPASSKTLGDDIADELSEILSKTNIGK